MVIPNFTINNHIYDIKGMSKYLNLNKLFIFTIIICDSFKYEIEEAEESTHIKHIKVGSSFFINNFLNSKDNTIDF
jgi:hypothetical protein